MVSLGDLWRQTGNYRDNEALTHAGNDIFANDYQLSDARSFAATDDRRRGLNYWLTLILCKDNRIAFTPFDEEEIDT